MEISRDGINTEKLSNEYLAYIAGYIDGEGCIRATKQSNGNAHGVHVFITNTYLPLLLEIKNNFGGKVSIRSKSSDKHRTVFQWRISRRKDIKLFLTIILPFLKEKREQAKLMLEYCDLPILRSNRYSNNYADVLLARQKRIDLSEKISNLKKIDYKNLYRQLVSEWNG